MTEIEQIIDSLAQTYNVKIEKDETMLAPLAYDFKIDVIEYNPNIINEAYGEVSKHARINLTDFIKYNFGHELGHRKKYKIYGAERAAEIEDTLMLFLREPTVAIELLEENEKHLFSNYRAVSISYVLFEEYYAVKENPLCLPSAQRADIIYRAKILKEYSQDIRRLMHSLVIFASEAIECYFVAPIAILPLKYFRIFPEFPIIRKIKSYLQNEIQTPHDVFDTDKMEELANILLYEL